MNARAVPVTDVDAINAELYRVRRETPGCSEPSASAATVNLVVFVDDAAFRPWVRERAALVGAKHPSRVLILDATRADGCAEVEALSADGPCPSQRVDLAIGGLEPAHVRSLVHSLTVAGVPTVFWWTSSRVLASPALSAIAELASTVVVDSSGSVAGATTIGELAAFLERESGLVVRDLAYMRLLPWQDMIAQFFDDDALFEDLFSIRTLEIDAGSDAEALYIAGWLASRLSWVVTGPQSFRSRRGDAVALKRRTVGQPRRVRRVALTSADSTYSAELSDDDSVVCLSVAGAKQKPTRCAPLSSIDNASLIEKALLAGGRDQIFETSLRTVAALLR